jgi:hypothetical protein
MPETGNTHFFIGYTNKVGINKTLVKQQHRDGRHLHLHQEKALIRTLLTTLVLLRVFLQQSVRVAELPSWILMKVCYLRTR